MSTDVGAKPPPLPRAGSKPPPLPRAASTRPQNKRTTSNVPVSSAQVAMTEQALLEEIDHSVREWSSLLKTYIVGGQAQSYHETRENISGIIMLRRELQDPETPEDKKLALRKEIIELFESTRKTQEGYMVPRNQSGAYAELNNTSVMQMVDLHKTMLENMRNESANLWKGRAEKRRAEEKARAMGDSKALTKAEYPEGPIHLYLDVKMCLFSFGEGSELHFSLYTAQDKTFITENFCLRLTMAGFPEELKWLGKMQTLFASLDKSDFEKDVYLVCKIFRRGKLIFDPKAKPGAKPPSRLYKRPFGCCCMSINSLLLESQLENEVSPPNDAMAIWMPANESRFDKIHEAIIAGTKDLMPAPRAKGIALGLRMFAGELDPVLHQVCSVTNAARDDKKDWVQPEELVVANKLRFPDMAHMNPGDNRNDMYVRLGATKSSQGGKTSAKNIEVLVNVVLDDGTKVENCLSRGVGDAEPESEFRTQVYYHLNSPNFNELVKLRIPNDVFERAHLLFTFWHVSSTEKKNSPFSFGWLPLCDASGAVINDGNHSITSYKPYSKMANTRQVIHFAQAAYLKSLPKECKPDKTTFQLSSTLLSTKKSHNAVLQGLFNWRGTSKASMKKVLADFKFINRGGLMELATFIRELFDNFFAIMDSAQLEDLRADAVGAVLHCLDLLTDRKLQFYTLVDMYIANFFDNRNAYSYLIRLTSQRLAAENAKPSKTLRTLCKTVHYVTKFADVSRHLEEQHNPAAIDDRGHFREQLREMMEQILTIVRNKAEGNQLLMFVRPAQAYLVRSFAELAENFKEYFPEGELGQIAQDLLNAIPESKTSEVNKLNLIRNLLAGSIGVDESARAVLFPTILDALKLNLSCIEQDGLSKPYLCIDILTTLLTLMQSADETGTPAQLPASFTELLEVMTRVCLLLLRESTGDATLAPPEETVLSTVSVDPRVDSVTILFTILHATSEESVQQLIQSMDRDRLGQFVRNLLEVCQRVTTDSIFPNMWTQLIFLQQKVATKVVALFAPPIRQHFFEGENFDADLWSSFFRLMFSLVSSDELQLESFSKKKQFFISERYGDMRLPLLEHIQSMWAHLAGQRSQFIVQLVPVLLNLTVNAKKEASTVGLDLLMDLMQEEHQLTDSFDQVERMTVDHLYYIKSLDDAPPLMALLMAGLLKRFEATTDQRLIESGTTYLKHLKKMDDLMSSLFNFPDTALYEDERTSVALELINYLDATGHVHTRKEMYCRYVQFLVDLHDSLQNYLEAGMTQLQQIRILEWSYKPIGAVKPYPEETESSRKLRYYKSAIEHFVRGGDYERAVEISEELRDHYENRVFDYNSLSQLLQDNASWFMKIATEERYYCNYFRVCYYGEGFEQNLREKEFVYRGITLEPVMDFTNRLKKKFPEAKINMSSDPPSDEARSQNNQIIGITTLTRPPEELRRRLLNERAGKPEDEPEPKWAGERNSHVPANMQAYRENMGNLGVFEYSKGDQRSTEKKPKNEFKDLWVAKTYIFTENSFPNNRRRMEVVARKEVSISPLENAVATIEAKNIELDEKISTVRAAPPGEVDVGPLSMNLNGIIDAAVNGGTKLYIEAFLCDEYLQLNPNDQPMQDKLKDALRHQISVLAGGLEVFGARCNESLLGLHGHLQGFYAQMTTAMGEIL